MDVFATKSQIPPFEPLVVSVWQRYRDSSEIDSFDFFGEQYETLFIDLLQLGILLKCFGADLRQLPTGRSGLPRPNGGAAIASFR